MRLEIVTPERTVFSGEITYLKAPSVDGYFGVLPRHTPMLVALKVGEIEIREGGRRRFFATSGGYAEVLPDRITILAETAEEASEIDVARAQSAKERALRRLREKPPGTDIDRARAALARALNRLRIAAKA